MKFIIFLYIEREHEKDIIEYDDEEYKYNRYFANSVFVNGNPTNFIVINADNEIEAVKTFKKEVVKCTNILNEDIQYYKNKYKRVDSSSLDLDDIEYGEIPFFQNYLYINESKLYQGYLYEEIEEEPNLVHYVTECSENITEDEVEIDKYSTKYYATRTINTIEMLLYKTDDQTDADEEITKEKIKPYVEDDEITPHFYTTFDFVLMPCFELSNEKRKQLKNLFEEDFNNFIEKYKLKNNDDAFDCFLLNEFKVDAINKVKNSLYVEYAHNENFNKFEWWQDVDNKLFSYSYENFLRRFFKD